MKDTFVNAMRLNTDRFQIKDFFYGGSVSEYSSEKKSHVTFVKKQTNPAFEKGFLCRIVTENTLNLITVCSICL